VKEVKVFVRVNFLVFLIKLIGGLLSHSITMITSGIYDLVLISTALFLLKEKENQKNKAIFSSIWGFLIILVGLGTIFISEIVDLNKTSFFVILFVLVALVVRYIVSCYFTNMNYQKKKGILNFNVINSTIDFVNYGVILGALVLCKLSKWIDIFKYGDRLGVIIISIFIIIKGIKVVINSFKYLEEKEENLVTDEIQEEIKKRSEVKKLGDINIHSFGGLRRVDCNLQLNNGISMVDVNSFVVTLQDYLLKIADAVKINLVENTKVVKKKAKVRSLKQDARNSGSRNSKTNTKKKNTKKKTKKR